MKINLGWTGTKKDNSGNTHVYGTCTVYRDQRIADYVFWGRPEHTMHLRLLGFGDKAVNLTVILNAEYLGYKSCDPQVLCRKKPGIKQSIEREMLFKTLAGSV